MIRAKAQSKTSYQMSAVSYQPRKGNKQAQSAGEFPEINRRFTQMDTEGRALSARRLISNEY